MPRAPHWFSRPPMAASSTQNVSITISSPPARRPPVRYFSRKLFSTRQPVISPRSSASPEPVTLWLVMRLSGFSLCKWPNDLMRNEALDYCLVVAAEEVDWLLCDAYRKWRLLRNKPPIEPFAASARGMILSEGAGAVLLGRDGRITLDRVASGKNFATRKDAPSLLREIYSTLNGNPRHHHRECKRNFHRSRRRESDLARTSACDRLHA